MKLQMTPVFPAGVVGAGGITVTVTNGVYTISLSSSAEPVIVAGDAVIAPLTGTLAVIRNNPVATTLLLPDVTLQQSIPLRIIDWSTNVIDHTITLTAFGAQSIMRQPTWPIASNAVQLGSLTLYPSVNLNGWYLAP